MEGPPLRWDGARAGAAKKPGAGGRPCCRLDKERGITTGSAAYTWHGPDCGGGGGGGPFDTDGAYFEWGGGAGGCVLLRRREGAHSG